MQTPPRNNIVTNRPGVSMLHESRGDTTATPPGEASHSRTTRVGARDGAAAGDTAISMPAVQDDADEGRRAASPAASRGAQLWNVARERAQLTQLPTIVDELLGEATLTIRRQRAKATNGCLLGDGFLSWQIPISVCLILFACANSVGVLLDSEQGQLSCKTVEGKQSCKHFTYDDAMSANCSSAYNCASAVENAHVSILSTLSIGRRRLGTGNQRRTGGYSPATRMLRRLGSLGGGGTAHRELSGHDACSKLVSSLRCDFDLQSLHGNLPNKTLVKSLCPELCCVPLNISQPIGTAVCPWNVARPRGIANTCNTSHLTRSWIKTCLVDHMTTALYARTSSAKNWTCGNESMFGGLTIADGLSSAYNHSQHALNVEWCHRVEWANEKFVGHPCGPGFAQLEPELMEQCRQFIAISTGQYLNGTELADAVRRGGCAGAYINFTRLTDGCGMLNNIPEQPTTITLPIVAPALSTALFEERLVHTFYQLSAHCTVPNASSAEHKKLCLGALGQGALGEFLQSGTGLLSLDLQPVCVDPVSPDSVIWYTYLSLVVQLAMVLVLVLGNYAACKEKFTKEDQAAAAEDITTLRQRLRNAAESVLMLLTMVACSACTMLHGWLQRSCQQMVDQGNMDVLVAVGKKHLADFDPLVMGAYFWNIKMQLFFVCIMLVSVIWRTYGCKLFCGKSRQTPLKDVLVTRSTQMRTCVFCSTYMLGGAVLYRVWYHHTFKTLAQAFYFVLVTCTTIGYGDMSPISRDAITSHTASSDLSMATGMLSNFTSGGRVTDVTITPVISVWIFMLYAMFGIVQLAALIGVVGDMLLDGVVQYELFLITKPVQLLSICCCSRGKRFLQKVRNRDDPGHGVAEAKIRTWLAVIMMLLCLLVLGPYNAQTMHCWGYHESLYWVFVTMTSIGFGDYYPGNEQAHWRDAVCNERFFGIGPRISHKHRIQRVDSSQVAIWLLAVDFILILMAVFSLVIKCTTDARKEESLTCGKAKVEDATLE